MNDYQYIKDELTNQSLTVSWLAKEVGVSKGYISKLINNKIKDPGSLKLQAIHCALNIEHIDKIIVNKKLFILDYDNLTLASYLYICESFVDNECTVCIVDFPENKLNTRVLENFYTSISSVISQVEIIELSQLEKIIDESIYDDVIVFNESFLDLNVMLFSRIKHIIIETPNRDTFPQNILLLSDNSKQLSIVLNSISLIEKYIAKDFYSYLDFKNKDVVINQLNMLSQIYILSTNNVNFIVGNEIVELEKSRVSYNSDGNLINFNHYFNLFDKVIYLNFTSSNSDVTKYLKQYKVIKHKIDIIEVTELYSNYNSIINSILKK